MQESKEAIFLELQKILHDLFEVEPDKVTLPSNLYEELGLDSIDAVDLIAHLQTITGRKFNPEEFKTVRTVQDVVDVIHAELSKSSDDSA